MYEILEPQTRDQQKRYHAMIADISRQWQHCGQSWGEEDMKRLLIDQFRRDTKDMAELQRAWLLFGPVRNVPSLDGSGVVSLGEQSRRFPKVLATAFIEWLFAFGADAEIEWTDPAVVPLSAYSRAA